MAPGRSNTESRGFVVGLGVGVPQSITQSQGTLQLLQPWDQQCSGNFQKKQLSKVSEVSWDATEQGGRAGLFPAQYNAKWVQPNINYSSEKREEPVHIDSSYLPVYFCGGHKPSKSEQTLSRQKVPLVSTDRGSRVMPRVVSREQGPSSRTLDFLKWHSDLPKAGVSCGCRCCRAQQPHNRSGLVLGIYLLSKYLLN